MATAEIISSQALLPLSILLLIITLPHHANVQVSCVRPRLLHSCCSQAGEQPDYATEFIACSKCKVVIWSPGAESKNKTLLVGGRRTTEPAISPRESARQVTNTPERWVRAADFNYQLAHNTYEMPGDSDVSAACGFDKHEILARSPSHASRKAIDTIRKAAGVLE